MSILDKPLASEQPRRRPRWPLFTFVPLIVLLLGLVAVTGPGTDAAFIQHFFSPPQHFTYSGHSDYVSSVAWSFDGKRIASASGDHTVQIWNASAGSHVLTYRGHTSDVSTLAWSPDGKYIASGSVDATVQIWNATTGQHLYTYQKHTDAVFSVAWSTDGKYIASGSNDGSLRVWQALTGTQLFSVQNPVAARNGATAPWNAVAWSPDGRYLAAGGYGNAQIFDARTGKSLSAAYGYQGGTIHAIAWSPDSQYIAVAESSGSVLIWNVATGKNVYGYNESNTDVDSVAWSPDGRRIVSGGNDAVAQVWDALTGQHVYTYRGHIDVYPGHFTSGAAVDAVAWSPDSTHIASGSNDHTVQVWKAPAS